MDSYYINFFYPLNQLCILNIKKILCKEAEYHEGVWRHACMSPRFSGPNHSSHCLEQRVERPLTFLEVDRHPADATVLLRMIYTCHIFLTEWIDVWAVRPQFCDLVSVTSVLFSMLLALIKYFSFLADMRYDIMWSLCVIYPSTL